MVGSPAWVVWDADAKTLYRSALPVEHREGARGRPGHPPDGLWLGGQWANWPGHLWRLISGRVRARP